MYLSVIFVVIGAFVVAAAVAAVTFNERRHANFVKPVTLILSSIGLAGVFLALAAEVAQPVKPGTRLNGIGWFVLSTEGLMYEMREQLIVTGCMIAVAMIAAPFVIRYYVKHANP